MLEIQEPPQLLYVAAVLMAWIPNPYLLVPKNPKPFRSCGVDKDPPTMVLRLNHKNPFLSGQNMTCPGGCVGHLCRSKCHVVH